MLENKISRILKLISWQHWNSFNFCYNYITHLMNSLVLSWGRGHRPPMNFTSQGHLQCETTKVD